MKVDEVLNSQTTTITKTRRDNGFEKRIADDIGSLTHDLLI